MGEPAIAGVTISDLAELVPGIDQMELGDLLPPVLGPLQGVLALYPGQYRLGYRDAQGVVHCRWLSPAALRRAVLQEPIDFGFLPPGVIACGLGASGTWLARYLPPTRHTISAQWGDRAVELTLPLPGLIFAGYGQDYFVWATNRPDWSPDHPLFHAPLANLYGNGRICWGRNQPPACSAATLDVAWRLFLASPFTGELSSNKSRAFPQDIRQRWQELVNRTRRPVRYPVRDLLPLRLTLRQALAQLARTTH